MARMYRTASANPLDYMYRMNVPLMAKVVEANDAFIDENVNQLTALGTAATTFPYLQDDETRAKAIADQYSKQIDEVTSAIRSDPANWRKQLEPIRGISKDLQNNYRVGEISKIAGNYGKFKQVSDYIDEQVKEFGKSGKGISADRARAYKQHFLSEWRKANPGGTAYDPKTGDYNAISVFDPMANIDVRKQLSEELDKMKANSEIRITDTVTGSGEYFNKVTQKWEGITPDRILKIVTDRLNNPQLMQYLKQDSQAGIISGVFDQDPNSPSYGQFIAPYSYDKVGINSDEQSLIDQMTKQIASTKNNNTKKAMQDQLDAYVKQLNERTKLEWNKSSYLAPIMSGIVDQYAYNQTEEGNDLSANPVWTTKYSQAQANARNSASIAAQNYRQQAGFAHAKEMYDIKRKDEMIDKMVDFGWKIAELAAKGTKKSSTPTSTKTTVKDKEGKAIGTINTPALNLSKTNTDNAIIGTLETTPFHWQSQAQNKLTTTLNDEIMIHQGSLGALEANLANLKKTNPDNKVLITNVENQIADGKAKLLTLESQRNTAIDYAINEWKKKGTYNEQSEQVARQYLSGRLKEDFDKANAEYQKLEIKRKELREADNPMSTMYENFMQRNYYPALAKKNRTEAMFNGGQRVFNTEIKPLSDTKLSKAAQETTYRKNIIQTTKKQDEYVLNLINTDPSSYKIYGREGKELPLSFEHGTATTDPAKFKIIGVAPTTGLGNKSVEIAAEMNGKRVIIIPRDDNNQLQSYLANEFNLSKNSDVKTIGSILSSPTAGTIADMFTEMRMNTGTSFGNKDAWTYRTIQNPANPLEVTRIRSRSISTGSGEPKWEFQVEVADEGTYMNHVTRTVPREGKRVRTPGVDFNYDESGKFKGGFVPMSVTDNPQGIFHNVEQVINVLKH